ncbi:MAG: hypothetical protein QOG66_1568, partial [Methylobacteriaceae bacterium]|nr:hypothetical protein [Methylobacteriaceae bacterium]
MPELGLEAVGGSRDSAPFLAA